MKITCWIISAITCLFVSCEKSKTTHLENELQVPSEVKNIVIKLNKLVTDHHDKMSFEKRHLLPEKILDESLYHKSMLDYMYNYKAIWIEDKYVPYPIAMVKEKLDHGYSKTPVLVSKKLENLNEYMGKYGNSPDKGDFYVPSGEVIAHIYILELEIENLGYKALLEGYKYKAYLIKEIQLQTIQP